MDDWDSFIDNLTENPEPIKLKVSTEKQYTCGQCSGTGLYSGPRVHQEKKHCFACKGKGYFKTDPRKLEKAKIARAKKKADAIESAKSFNSSISIFDRVQAIASWHTFASSLMLQHHEGKQWSERQVAAMCDALDRIDAKKTEREAAAISVDLQAIIDLFQKASQSGYKRPVYRAEGLKLSLAPTTGVNAGSIYVKDDEGAYLGKVTDGKFFGQDAAREALKVISSSPRDAAIRYGQKTGTCACCGRALTNKESVTLGIGPICADKWGLL